MGSRVSTQVDISESMSSYIIACYIKHKYEIDPKFEYYLNHVDTGKFSIADVYVENRDTAVEVKSLAHGNAALKGVIQASMYKEQCDNSLLFMQKPRRESLTEGIENFARSHGVGVIFLEKTPSICSKKMVVRATGGCPNPFNVWRRDRLSTTKMNIIANSQSDKAEVYLDTIEKLVSQYYKEMFDFAVKPNKNEDGFYDIYSK